jgi:predicted exporter
MWLLIVYVGLVLIGDVADYLISLFVEQMWGEQASLISFLLLYFASLWLAWVAAIKITEPRGEAQAA